jgi:hypothetical protein
MVMMFRRRSGYIVVVAVLMVPMVMMFRRRSGYIVVVAVFVVPVMVAYSRVGRRVATRNFVVVMMPCCLSRTRNRCKKCSECSGSRNCCVIEIVSQISKNHRIK